MNYIDKKLTDYCEQNSSSEPGYLTEISRQTYLTQINPRMLSGHLQGRFLKMIVQLMQPINILEIGTYTGYSAICMAEALPEKGKIDTIELNEELETTIQSNIEIAGFKGKIRLHIGDALKIIPQMLETVTYDLVFIDADKQNYPAYFNLLKDKLNSGAVILSDNVLWSGKVVDDEERANDHETKIIHQFNEMLKADDSFETLILPVRDGISIARKK
jgi:caffeoyl-CoA O-methyltransferase